MSCWPARTARIHQSSENIITSFKVPGGQKSYLYQFSFSSLFFVSSCLRGEILDFQKSDIHVIAAHVVELGARLPVMRAHGCDQVPESSRVVHLDKMGKFVRDDVIDRRLRRLDQPPVEPDLAFDVATAPARLCAGKKQPRDCQAVQTGVYADALGEIRRRVAAIPFQDRGSDRPGTAVFGKRDLQAVRVAQGRQCRGPVFPEMQPQIAAKIFYGVAIGPRLVAGGIRAPDGKFPEDPVRRIAGIIREAEDWVLRKLAE